MGRCYPFWSPKPPTRQALLKERRNLMKANKTVYLIAKSFKEAQSYASLGYGMSNKEEIERIYKDQGLAEYGEIYEIVTAEET
jgi:hypothetical protein